MTKTAQLDQRTQAQFLLSPLSAYAVSIFITLACFYIDVSMPRGATAAIGYCLVPVIGVATRKSWFLFGITATCLALTWIACVIELPGASLWMSIFDRSTVSAVVILTFSLVLRRSLVLKVLLKQTDVLEEAKLQLETSNTELANFASVVAHDLRGPLNTINMLLQLIARKGPAGTDRERSERIDMARAEVIRMSSMIANLLKYGRIGAAEVQLGACDVEAVLDDVVRSLNAQIAKASAQVTHDPLPTVRADSTLIGSLFQNLIENSIKYRSKAAPQIHVSAIALADHWQFTVQDNGIGIGAEDAARVFEPFRQVKTSKSASMGVGLGLATCKRIVTKHGGRIEVKSTVGKGATFVFTLPNQRDSTIGDFNSVLDMASIG